MLFRYVTDNEIVANKVEWLEDIRYKDRLLWPMSISESEHQMLLLMLDPEQLFSFNGASYDIEQEDIAEGGV